jgi:hypothetical protein
MATIIPIPNNATLKASSKFITSQLEPTSRQRPRHAANTPIRAELDGSVAAQEQREFVGYVEPV